MSIDALELFSVLCYISCRILCNTADMWLQCMCDCLRNMLHRISVRLKSLSLCLFVVLCLSLL